MSDASTATSPKIQRRATGTDTVTIACNLPNGHILQLYDIEEVESIMPNGRAIKENMATLNLEHGQWALNGSKLDMARLQSGDMPDYRVIKGTTPDCGYALTPGIPRDFAERWFEQNKRNPLVTLKHIYMAGTEDRAVGQARDFKDFKSGFQGLNQAGDYRVPSGRNIRKYSPTDNRTTPEQASLPEE